MAYIEVSCTFSNCTILLHSVLSPSVSLCPSSRHSSPPRHPHHSSEPAAAALPGPPGAAWSGPGRRPTASAGTAGCLPLPCCCLSHRWPALHAATTPPASTNHTHISTELLLIALLMLHLRLWLIIMHLMLGLLMLLGRRLLLPQLILLPMLLLPVLPYATPTAALPVLLLQIPLLLVWGVWWLTGVAVCPLCVSRSGGSPAAPGYPGPPQHPVHLQQWQQPRDLPHLHKLYW